LETWIFLEKILDEFSVIHYNNRQQLLAICSFVLQNKPKTTSYIFTNKADFKQKYGTIHNNSFSVC